METQPARVSAAGEEQLKRGDLIDNIIKTLSTEVWSELQGPKRDGEACLQHPRSLGSIGLIELLKEKMTRTQ